MPQRGPKCTLGYSRVFHLIFWGLYTGRQWQGLPVPHAPAGKPARHSTTVSRVCATWAAAGALWQAFLARGRPLAAAPHLAPSGRHGDGTNTVATKGGMAWGPQGIT